MIRDTARQPPNSREPNVDEFLAGLFAEDFDDPLALFVDEPHRAILHTQNGRRAFDVLPLKPGERAKVQKPGTISSFGAPAPEAPPVVGIDAEWVWVEGSTNRILSYQFAVICGGRALRGIVTCKDGLRLTLGDASENGDWWLRSMPAPRPGTAALGVSSGGHEEPGCGPAETATARPIGGLIRK